MGKRVQAVMASLKDKDLLKDGVLDQAVHDAASENASAVNNSGMEGQVEYLLTQGWQGSAIAFQAGEEAQRLVEDAEIEQRRDEKRGLYPDKIDPAN
jgi:predicted PilT family ATPase